MVPLNILILLAIFLVSVYIYFPLNRRRSKFYWKSPIDRVIPVIPVFIIPYYFYLIYAPISFLFVWLIAPGIFVRFLVAFTFANFTAAFFWYIYPNGIRRIKIRRKGLWFRFVNDLYSIDKYDTNAFPSNHVYGSIICSFFLSLAFPIYTWVFLIIGTLIVLSTILLKQHHTTDLLAGLIWATTSIIFAGLF